MLGHVLGAVTGWLPEEPPAERLCYLWYTSGSTGKPKASLGALLWVNVGQPLLLFGHLAPLCLAGLLGDPRGLRQLLQGGFDHGVGLLAEEMSDEHGPILVDSRSIRSKTEGIPLWVESPDDVNALGKLGILQPSPRCVASPGVPGGQASHPQRHGGVRGSHRQIGLTPGLVFGTASSRWAPEVHRVSRHPEHLRPFRGGHFCYLGWHSRGQVPSRPSAARAVCFQSELELAQFQRGEIGGRERSPQAARYQRAGQSHCSCTKSNPRTGASRRSCCLRPSNVALRPAGAGPSLVERKPVWFEGP